MPACKGGGLVPAPDEVAARTRTPPPTPYVHKHLAGHASYMFSRGMVRLPLSELSGVVSEPVKSASAIERPRQRPPALRPGRGRRSSQTLSARGRVTSPAIAPGSWRPSSGWPETASFATGGDRGGTRRLPRPLSRGLPSGLPRRLAPIIPVGTGIFADDDLHRLLGAAFLPPWPGRRACACRTR